MSGFRSVLSVLTGFVVPTRTLRFWKSAGWVFHLSVLICLMIVYRISYICRELLCCSILLTFLIALYSVLLKSLVCCLTAALDDPLLDSFAGFHFIPTNSSNLCDCKNVFPASRYLLLSDSVVPANHMFLWHLTVLLPFL